MVLLQFTLLKTTIIKYQYFLLYLSTLLLKGYKRKYWYFDNESFENKNHKSYHLISLVTPWMFTKQTDSKFEKWVESGLSTFEIRRLVAEIYFSMWHKTKQDYEFMSSENCKKLWKKIERTVGFREFSWLDFFRYLRFKNLIWKKLLVP